MKTVNSVRWLRISLWGIALLLVVLTPAISQNSNPGVIPIQAKAHGMTYGEWSAGWWKWLLGIPADQTSPFNWPNTGACSTGQLGSVWYLIGISPNPGTATITCTIPPGKALFFPLINVECSSLEIDPFFGATAAARQICTAADLQGVGNLFAEVDGVPLLNLTSYRAASPDFDFVVPYPNILSVPGHDVAAGAGKAAADGYYIMMAPLSHGTHTLHFGGSVLTGPLAGFSIDTTYHLTISN